MSETLHAANGCDRDEVKKLRDMLLTLPIKTKKPTECWMLAYDCHTRSIFLGLLVSSRFGHTEIDRFERCRSGIYRSHII